MKLDEIRFLAQIMRESDLTSLEVSEGALKIRLEKKSPPPPPPAVLISGGAAPGPAAQPVAEPAAQKHEDHLKEIKSPMVGVFYTSSSPESEPFVKVGSTVKKGDVVCIVEAMKLLNEINADQDGEVAEICAENGQVVEYGQTLFRLR